MTYCHMTPVSVSREIQTCNRNVKGSTSQKSTLIFAEYVRVTIFHFSYSKLLDVTPPSVVSCPSDVLESTNVLQKAMYWTPPTFSDNVKVVSIISNREPGFLMDAYRTVIVRYEASDAAGNVAYCLFNVTLEGRLSPCNSQSCDTLVNYHVCFYHENQSDGKSEFSMLTYNERNAYLNCVLWTKGRSSDPRT